MVTVKILAGHGLVLGLAAAGRDAPRTAWRKMRQPQRPADGLARDAHTHSFQKSGVVLTVFLRDLRCVRPSLASLLI
jgi:hypothetical protein